MRMVVMMMMMGPVMKSKGKGGGILCEKGNFILWGLFYGYKAAQRSRTLARLVLLYLFSSSDGYW